MLVKPFSDSWTIFFNIFRDLPFVYVYLDDILVASDSRTAHETHVDLVLKRLAQAGLVLNVNKCVKREVSFLGHVVNEQGIKANPARVQAWIVKSLKQFVN